MVFYRAMIIFAQKHFSSKNARIYSTLIYFAIYLRAALGILRRVVLTIFEPIVDYLLIFLGFVVFVPYWEQFKFGLDNYFPPEYYRFVIPSYIFIWMFFVFFFGGYEKRIKPASLLKGVFAGTVFVVVVYALLPESLRYSRALILIGSVWAFVSVFFVRLLGGVLFNNRKLISLASKKRVAIVGSRLEAKRVISILDESQLNCDYIGRITVQNDDVDAEVLGEIIQVEDITRINKIDELVFCSQDLSASSIIEAMLLISNTSIEFKIAPPESASVIGSNSINTTGDLYVVDIHSLNTGLNKRKKRLFDIVSGVALFILAPLVMHFMYSPFNFLKNTLYVIAGKLTWIGVTFDGQKLIAQNIFRKGVLNPTDGLKQELLNDSLSERMNIMYAKEYKIVNDLAIIFKGFRSLGRRT
jgi:hypothetical protein